MRVPLGFLLCNEPESGRDFRVFPYGGLFISRSKSNGLSPFDDYGVNAK
jgi:hypothetical protein